MIIEEKELIPNVVYCVGGLSGLSREKQKPYTMLHVVQQSRGKNFVGCEVQTIFLNDQFEIPVNKYITFDLAFVGGRFVPVSFVVLES